MCIRFTSNGAARCRDALPRDALRGVDKGVPHGPQPLRLASAHLISRISSVLAAVPILLTKNACAVGAAVASFLNYAQVQLRSDIPKEVRSGIARRPLFLAS